jgi:hypothetical protein
MWSMIFAAKAHATEIGAKVLSHKLKFKDHSANGVHLFIKEGRIIECALIRISSWPLYPAFCVVS